MAIEHTYYVDYEMLGSNWDLGYEGALEFVVILNEKLPDNIEAVFQEGGSHFQEPDCDEWFPQSAWDEAMEEIDIRHPPNY